MIFRHCCSYMVEARRSRNPCAFPTAGPVQEMLALSQAGAKAPMRRFFWPDLQPGFWASDPASEIESRPWAEIEPLLNRATC